MIEDILVGTLQVLVCVDSNFSYIGKIKSKEEQKLLVKFSCHVKVQ